MRLLLALVIINLVSGDYNPGEPGSPWTEEELSTVKDKLYTLFKKGTHRNTNFAAQALRLSFHDCLKYTDGSGGCDGCLNWEGVDVVLNTKKMSFANPKVDKTNNKGLEKIVHTLESIYTDRKFPQNSPVLKKSLKQSGKSRADFWAYAGQIAVEFAMETNNIACNDNKDPFIVAQPTCMHNPGTPECYITPDRPIRFQYGRADCTDHDETTPFITKKEEEHPSAMGNGKDTIDFFKSQFGFNGRETAAIFGAHTIGQLQVKNSLFPYIWTSSGSNTFNNDYYKVIIGEPRLFFDDPDCIPTFDAFGNMPKTRWIVTARGLDVAGGPTQWIHESLICPERNSMSATRRRKSQSEKHCLENVPAGQQCHADPPAGGEGKPRTVDQPDGDVNRGCERYRFVFGRDEMAINAEMGLYRDFQVTDGIIHGCSGLEVFQKIPLKEYKRTLKSSLPGKGTVEPDCGKQMLSEPPGSQPLYQIIEEFAHDQTSWINEFIPAFEKMTRNGYDSLQTV